MKARRVASLLSLLALLLAFLSLSSSSLVVSVSAQQGGFDAAAAGDFEPDIAGEPLAPLAPAVEDEDEVEAPAPAPPAKKAAAAAPAPAAPPAAAAAAAAAPKKKEEQPKPAPAKKEDSSPSSLPYADLLYTLLARRATFDARTKKLTLEGVFPIVAAVKVGKGDGRGQTSLKGEGRDHECTALVAKTARRSSATRFFGDSFKRNGTWLNSPTALLMGTDTTRSGAELALRLSEVKYSPSSSTVVFRAEQLDPSTAKERPGRGEKTALRSSGGVVGSWAALAASSGKWLDAKGGKVVLQDVILNVDAPYSRQEYQLKGWVEG